MKWIRFTLDTHTDAVDILSYRLNEIGVEGIEIEDKLPLSQTDKEKMFVDILPDPEDDDGTAKVHFYMEPEDCNPEKIMLQVEDIFQDIKQKNIYLVIQLKKYKLVLKKYKLVLLKRL